MGEHEFEQKALTKAIERQQFETAISERRYLEVNSFKLDRSDRGTYYADDIESAWIGWCLAKGIKEDTE